MNELPWLVWQLSDSAFPSGGFAHSNGLEATLNWGEIRNRLDFIDFTKVALSQTGRNCLPLVLAAHQETLAFEEIDELADAMLTNHVANRASRRLGRSLVVSTNRAFRNDHLQILYQTLTTNSSPSHLAPSFGAVCVSLGVDKHKTARLFLFTTLRDLISSAVRLNIVGPIEGQSIQRFLSQLMEDIVQRSIQFGLEDLASTAPALDIFQQTHDRIYSRLFQS